MAKVSAQGNAGTMRMTTKAADKPRSFRINFIWLLVLLLAIDVIIAFVRNIILGEQASMFGIIASTEKVELDVILGVLLSLAVAIERLLETGFAWFEQMVMSAANIAGKVARGPLEWVAKEYENALSATKELFHSSKVKVDDKVLGSMKAAEARLALAEERLSSWTNAPKYKAFKNALCIWIGLIVGTIVAILGDIGLFTTAGVKVPRILDTVVTGILIGAGPGPMHSLIGIIQGAKDALKSVADLSRGKAITEAVDRLKREMGK